MAAPDSTLQRIQTYLETQDKSQLIRHLLDIIRADEHLQQRWSAKLNATLNKSDGKALKKSITAALPINKHLHHYPQVRSYFAKLEPVVENLLQHVEALPPEQALDLAEYAIDRMQKALETIDDSGGFRLPSLEHLQAMHIRAIGRLPWSRSQVAESLFTQNERSDRDLYPAIPADYAEALGEEGMQAYYTLARNAWDALPPAAPGMEWDEYYPYHRLGRFLLTWAEAHQDFDGALAIKLKQAADRHDFVRITEYCIKHQQWTHARRWLNKVKTFAPDKENWGSPRLDAERLEQAILLQEGEVQKALQLQWHIFSHSALLEDYQQLLTLEKRAGSKQRFAAESRRYLNNRLTSEANEYARSRYATALLDILLHEQDLAEALALVRKHEVESEPLHQLAKTFAAQPVTAFELYQRLVDASVSQGNNRGYRHAVALLRECQVLVKTPAHRLAFLQLLDALHSSHKAKRNFIQLMNDTFG